MNRPVGATGFSSPALFCIPCTLPTTLLSRHDDEDSAYVFPPVSQDISPVHAIGADEPEIQWATCAGVVHPGANGQEDSRNWLEDEANLH
jgi:hypothetical protein